jgi:formate dehydrogenase subunit gamma
MTRVDQAVPPGRILRYNFSERITHWVAAISYIYLMLTGLAFWSPWLFWIAVILGGAPVSRMLHPWIGLIFVGSVTLMYGMWAPQMKSTDTDRQWWKSIGNYVQNRDDKMPPAGRYNAGQKLLFWSFFLAGLVLFVTGLVLWLPEYIPWSLRWLRYLAVFLHPVAALNATIQAGIEKSPADPPRRANDDNTDRWDRVRRANPACRAVILGTYVRR